VGFAPLEHFVQLRSPLNELLYTGFSQILDPELNDFTNSFGSGGFSHGYESDFGRIAPGFDASLCDSVLNGLESFFKD
jgi:hypothetical protein